jgi:PAS domain S-box-containing protein
MIRVLLIEDNPADTRLFREHLRDAVEAGQFAIRAASTLAEGLSLLNGTPAEVVFLDLGLPDSQGLGTYQSLRRARPRVPIVILSGARDEDLAVAAVQAGAQDYLFKGETTGPLIMRAARYAMERVKSEQALRDSEQSLRKAQAVAHIGSWVWHIRENRLEWSDEMYSIFGIDKTGFAGNLDDVISRAIHPDDREAVKKSNLSVAQEGIPIPLEYRVIWPDGTVRTVWAEAGELVKDADGKPGTLSGIVQDITERKRSGAAVRASELRFRRLFESAKDGILILDAQTGRIVDVNPYLTELLGFSHEQITDKKVWELGFFRDVIANRDNFLELQRKDFIRYEDLPLETHDGRKIEVEFVSNVYDVNGRKVIQCNIRNITERKNAEREIRSMARFPAENPAPVLRIARDGLLAYANPAAYRFIDGEMAVGKRAPVFLGALAAGALENNAAQSIETERSQRVFTITAVPFPDAGYINLYGIDITDQKRAMEALQKSESNLSETQKMAQLGQWMWDVKTGDVEWSEEVFRIFHLDPKTFTPRIDSILAFSPWPEDHERDRELIRKATETREKGDYEQRFLRPDGSLGYYYSTFQGKYDDAGVLVAIIGTVMDITDRKNAEVALRSLTVRLETILAAVPEIVMEVNAEKVYIWANQAGLDFFGDDVIGRRAADYFIGEQETYESVQPIFSGSEETICIESLQRRRDGRERVLEWRCRTLKDDKGAVTGALSSARDITERREAQAALQESEGKFRNLFEHSPVGKSMTGLDGSLHANSSFCKITGYSEDDLRHMKWQAITHPDDIRASEEAISSLLKGKQELVRFEKRYIHRDGHIVWADVSTYLQRDTKSVPQFFITSVMDITARKKAEEDIKALNTQLEQRVEERTVQLKNANRELEAFAYSVSHDLRAPLRAIDGFTEILLEDYESSLDAEGKRVCSVICENTRRMGQLIDDLLAFSRLGKTPLSRSRIDMGKAARRAYEEAVPPDARQRVDFQVDNPPAAPGDLAMIRQVWANLISNAVKFSSRRERAAVSVTGVADAGMAVYCVRDNGTGFDMRHAEKLFGVFQRLHGRNEFEGTGVGLAIVKRIVERHGGRVWAESEPDRGAAFYFSLPLETDQAKGEPNG